MQAGGFVDATGDAVVVWQAGLECREPAEGVIYGSQMIVIENLMSRTNPAARRCRSAFATAVQGMGWSGGMASR